MDIFDKKKILITGGTGSLGQALTKKFFNLMLTLLEFLVEMNLNKLR